MLKNSTMTQQTYLSNTGCKKVITTKEGYPKLKRFLDDLNFQEYHFVNSNDICTPLGCVEEMVNSIPKNFWNKKNLKILDPCCGNGNFHGYISQKTNLKRLWFNDINKTSVCE